MAIHDEIKDIVSMRNIAIEVGMIMDGPTALFSDEVRIVCSVRNMHHRQCTTHLAVEL